MMNKHDALELEVQEPFTIKVEEPSSVQRHIVSSWFRRIITLDDLPNQKHHRPALIIFMSILHVFIFSIAYISTTWGDSKLAYNLFDLFKLYVPCMRPAPYGIRTEIANCRRPTKNGTCSYDDVLGNMCFSFTYPHQIWRMVTVNLFHMGWLHLISNLLAQLLQGIPLERKYGTVRMAIIYWLSGVGASLCFIIKNMHQPAAGSSGSMYGLMLFLIVDRLIAIRVNTASRTFIIIQLAILLLPHIIASIPLMIKYNVGHSAHFGGGLVGFLIAFGMNSDPWPFNNENCIGRTTCRRIVFILLILYYIITFAIFFSKDVPIVHSISYKTRAAVDFT